jgi:hypothetical protein
VNALGRKLATELRKVVGRTVDVVEGLYQPPPLGGLRSMLFVAVDSFVDHGGLTLEGAHSAPMPTDAATRPGFYEERPGRITVSLACVSLSLPAVQELCEVAAPAGLAVLAGVQSIALGSTEDRTCTLEFRDMSASLRSVTFRTEPDKDRPFCLGSIVFHLEGFLRVELHGTRRAVRKTASRPARKGTRSR